MLKRLMTVAAASLMSLGVAGGAQAALIDTAALGLTEVSVFSSEAATLDNTAGVNIIGLAGSSISDTSAGFDALNPASHLFVPQGLAPIFGADQVASDAASVEFLFALPGGSDFLLAVFTLDIASFGPILTASPGLFFFDTGVLDVTEFTTNAVPLPAAGPLLATALVAFGFASRRRRKAA